VKRIAIGSLVLLAAWALVAAGVAAESQYSRQMIEQGFTSFVESGGHVGNVNFGSKPRGGVVLATVNDVAGQVKAYSRSTAFRQKWTEYAQRNVPSAPQPMLTLAQLRMQSNGPSNSDVDKQFAAALENIKSLPPDTQAKVRAQMDQARAQMKAQQGQKPQVDDATLLSREKARYDHDKAKYDEALKMAPPQDPNAAIRKALQTALDETSGVDYNAPLRGRQFASEAYEQKPEPWKMAYRVGRPGTEAARSFAQKWLAELR
jgi:hypothetical protein